MDIFGSVVGRKLHWNRIMREEESETTNLLKKIAVKRISRVTKKGKVGSTEGLYNYFSMCKIKYQQLLKVQHLHLSTIFHTTVVF